MRRVGCVLTDQRLVLVRLLDRDLRISFNAGFDDVGPQTVRNASGKATLATLPLVGLTVEARSDVRPPRAANRSQSSPLCQTNFYFEQRRDYCSTLSSAVLSQNTISTRITYDFHDMRTDAIGRP